MKKDDVYLGDGLYYLGDGLYARDDGFMFTLYCHRDGVIHWVALEPDVVQEFIKYIERKRNLKITAERCLPSDPTN